jgi:uncharacterized membrane protein
MADENEQREVPFNPAQRNVSAVSRLEQDALEMRSLAQRVSDVVTRAVGSITSITLHVAVLLAWILVNLGSVPGVQPFDPFPFGILTLIVSTEGVLLALIILISQNRMIHQADRRAHLDLQVNLLAEQETTLVLHQLQRIARHLGLPPGDRDAEAETLIEETDVDEVVRHLEETLPKE